MSIKDEIKWYNVILTGSGFLADAYDLFVINVVVDIMANLAYKQPLTTTVKANVKSMALVGAFFGQIFFGALADIIGRKKVFVSTCAMIIIGAIMSASVVDSETWGIYSQLTFWRFVLGFGVGGEYPLSASITSESSSPASRTKALAFVFSMQGFGALLCSFVLVIATQGISNEGAQWRFALAMGGLPMAIAFYFRWKMHTDSWEEHQLKQHRQEVSKVHDMTIEMTAIQGEDVSRTNMEVFSPIQSINATSNKKTNIDSPVIAPRRNRDYEHQSPPTSFMETFQWFCNVIYAERHKLVGTAGTWFILDVVFYANGLFSGQVSKTIGFVGTPKGEAISTLVLNSISLPGYLFTVYYCEKVGLKRIQEFGFVVIIIVFFVMACLFHSLIKVHALFIILYGVTFFFQNFGPNATTYIIPSLIYTPEHKGTCHGISAAAGKLGAIFGTYIFAELTDSFCTENECDDGDSETDVEKGLQLSVGICCIFAFLGIFWSRSFVSLSYWTASLVERKESAASQPQTITVE